MLKQTAITPEGRRVMKNVYRFSGTHGLPLDFILQEFRQHNCVVDWLDYWEQACREMDPKAVHVRILTSLETAHGPAYAAAWNRAFLSALSATIEREEESE